MSSLTRFLSLAFLLWAVGPKEAASSGPAVDWYGVRSVDRDALHEALGLAPDAALEEFDRKAAEKRLREVDGVADAKLTLLMIPGNPVLFAGIEEEGARELVLKEEPRGEPRLPAEMIEMYDEIQQIVLTGLRRGVSREDRLDGYALSRFKPARARQMAFRDLALEQGENLATVLAQSADAKHRAVAARAIAFLPDKKAIVPLLTDAMLDPSAEVRNNSTRALLVLADWATEQEEFSVELEQPAPVLAMLESLHWTDRNKATGLLLHVTEDRDPELFQKLHAESIPALEEMARWRIDGYSYACVMVLGRLAGIEEERLRARAKEASEGEEESRQAWIDGLVAKARAEQ